MTPPAKPKAVAARRPADETKSAERVFSDNGLALQLFGSHHRHLARIEQKLKPAPTPKAAAKPQAPPPRPGRPDPAKVYAFAAGDSPAKGPKDAWVTVIEVSEFQ